MVFRNAINSRKFWYTIAGVIIPIVSVKLGLDEESATKIAYSIIALVIGQGIADIKK